MKLILSLNSLFDNKCSNICPSISNSKQRKIKNRLKTLRNHMANYGLIAIKWAEFGYFNGLLLVFRHGTITSICFASDGSICSVYHENYLHTKLASHRVSSIEIDSQYILVSYIEPYLTYISLDRNFDSKKKYLKFKLKSNCISKTIQLDRNNRHILSKRNLIVSPQHAIVWWNTTLFSNWSLPGGNCQAPNLTLIKLDSLSIIASERISGEIIKNNFVYHEPNNFGVLCRQSNISFSLTYMVFEIGSSNSDSTSIISSDHKSNKVDLKTIFNANIPLDKSCLYAEFTKLQDKILLLCDDESVMLFNIEQNVLYSLHSSMPVCYMASNPLDAIFVTCNQYGRLSMYDVAFNNIAFDIQHCNSTESVLNKNGDIGILGTSMSIKRLQFLSPQMLALVLVDNKRQDVKNQTTQSTSSSTISCQLLLLTLSHEVDFKFLTHEYLHLNKYEEALNILRVINWNCSFEQAYYCLNEIFQYFLKLPLDNELESKIESTLATFLIPCTPIDYKIFEQILPFIRHLAIRFFYHLIRNQSYSKAYQLGIELKSRRHFLLLYQIAKQNGLNDLMRASFNQVQQLTA